MDRYFANKSFLIWDFDGVIKESLEVKTSAFKKLFIPFGEKIVSKVIKHHQSNGGVSRYSKIPLYLKWANVDNDEETIEYFCQSFSDLVKEAVIDSPWVPGVMETLNKNHKKKLIFLFTATPQKEIEFILKDLGIFNFFKRVIGHPIDKSSALKSLIEEYKIRTSQAIVIGDSKTDLKAAQNFNVQFLLRKTNINQSLQKLYNGPQIDNFLE